MLQKRVFVAVAVVLAVGVALGAVTLISPAMTKMPPAVGRVFTGVDFGPNVERHGKVAFVLKQTAKIALADRGVAGHYLAPKALAWSADGTQLAAICDDGERLLVMDNTGRILHDHKDAVSGWSPFFLRGTSQILFKSLGGAPSEKALSVREVGTGKVISEVPMPEGRKEFHRQMLHDFSVSPDGSQAVLAMSGNEFVTTYRTKDWTVERTVPTSGFYTDAFAYFPDNRRIAITLRPSKTIPAQVNTLIVVDGTAGSVLDTFDFSDPEIYSIAISPDQTMIMVGASFDFTGGPDLNWQTNPRAVVAPDAVRIFSTSDRQTKASFAAYRAVQSVAWGEQQKFVAFIDARYLYLWQPFATAPSYLRVGMGSPPTAMAMSADGRHIAVATWENIFVYSVQ